MGSIGETEGGTGRPWHFLLSFIFKNALEREKTAATPWCEWMLQMSSTVSLSLAVTQFFFFSTSFPLLFPWMNRKKGKRMIESSFRFFFSPISPVLSILALASPDAEEKEGERQTHLEIEWMAFKNSPRVSLPCTSGLVHFLTSHYDVKRFCRFRYFIYSLHPDMVLRRKHDILPRSYSVVPSVHRGTQYNGSWPIPTSKK